VDRLSQPHPLRLEADGQGPTAGESPVGGVFLKQRGEIERRKRERPSFDHFVGAAEQCKRER